MDDGNHLRTRRSSTEIPIIGSAIDNSRRDALMDPRDELIIELRARLATAERRATELEARAAALENRLSVALAQRAADMTDDARVFVDGAGWMTLAQACAHYGRTIASIPDSGSR